MAVGSLIEATDYNLIQSTISGIMGSTSSGYGQTLSSAQVISGSKITAVQWNNLQSDITNAWYHQLGTSVYLGAPTYNSALLTTASTTTKIYDADRAAYLAVAQALANTSSTTVGGVTYPGAYVAPPTGQNTTPVVSPGSLPWSSQRTANWGGQVSSGLPYGTVGYSESGATKLQHQLVLTWNTVLSMDYFFNSGASIFVNASFSANTVTSKTQAWYTLLANMGTITFNINNTTSNGSQGTGSSYGWAYFLANPNVTQTIFTAAFSASQTPESTYAPCSYSITCVYTPGSTLTFTAIFDDLEEESYTTTGYKIQEDIAGTTTNTFNMTYASGSSVSVASYLPTATNGAGTIVLANNYTAP
jgi:hypothetical protein